jgi:DNA adenine methylase
MCGSANVAINVDYPLITINDVNDDVINLFEVIRNHFDEFIRVVYFTPFSRAELYKIIDDAVNTNINNIERARRYYVRAQLGYGANGSQNLHYGAGFEYKLQKTNYYRVDNWNIKLERLSEIVHKLRFMQIEHRDALELFEKVNRPDNFVYFDPPYLMGVRKSKKRYRFEVDDDFHHKMAAAVTNAKCLIAISGYDSKVYDDLFGHLHKTTGPLTKINTKKTENRECLWTNYVPAELNGSGILKLDL